MSTLAEVHAAADRERRELRRGDSSGPWPCCDHEGRHHGPDGCAMPGCGCLAPKRRLQTAERYVESFDRVEWRRDPFSDWICLVRYLPNGEIGRVVVALHPETAALAFAPLGVDPQTLKLITAP